MQTSACAAGVGVSALACAIAEKVESDAELAVLATVFTQLGDTLATMLAFRACEISRTEK